MQRTVLITGATDGIGLAAARLLLARGHHVVLHGRDPVKLSRVHASLGEVSGNGRADTVLADLSRLAEVEALAGTITERYAGLDVLVNNAGVLSAAKTTTPDGLDVRFAVNTIAPYLLTRRLLPLLGSSGRVVNVSSAAQSPVDPRAMTGTEPISEGDAYAQSKLALTMWTAALARELGDGPAVVAVNPGSMLGTKMVREGFGVAGREVSLGAEILARGTVDPQFQQASGRYFDNDQDRFASPHPDALDAAKSDRVVREIEAILAARLSAHDPRSPS